MIAFQHIQTGRFLAREKTDACLLYDAYPWHESDEDRLRSTSPHLKDYRTVTFSTRIDHPMNDLSRISPEELAARYPMPSLA